MKNLSKKLIKKIGKRLKRKNEEKSDYKISYMPKDSPLDQNIPYKLKVNQSDLADYEQNFFSAAQVIHKVQIKNAPYIPTYKFEGQYINENHKSYAFGNPGIEGWLCAEDALKIYELAYFSEGDILELGTYKGLSASVIVQAIKDSRKSLICDTVDINHATTRIAKSNLEKKFGSIDTINFHIYNGCLFMDSMIVQNKKYGFIFIDGGHGYKNTYMNALRMNRLLIPGGFALFHDYLVQRNFDKNSYYGVYQAVNDALLTDCRFVYCGAFGSTALFRYVGGHTLS